MKFKKLWIIAPLVFVSWCAAMDEQSIVIGLSQSTEVVPDAATPLDRTPITLVPLTDNGALAHQSTQRKKKRHVSRSVSSHSASNNNSIRPIPEYWIIDINTLASHNRGFAATTASTQRNEHEDNLDSHALLEKLTRAQHKHDFCTLIRLSHNIQAQHNKNIIDSVDDVGDTVQRIGLMLHKGSRNACLTALGFGALSVISSTAVALICFYSDQASS